LLNSKEINMKKILLSSIFVLAIGGIVVAQEKKTPKPALESTVKAKKAQRAHQKAQNDKQIALKKAEAKKANNTAEQSIPAPTPAKIKM
jgi:uncharacterized protein (UPF0254 family)